MLQNRMRGRGTALLAVVGLVAGSAVVAWAFPAGGNAPGGTAASGTGGAPASQAGTPRQLFAQGLGVGGGFPGRGGPGGPGGPGGGVAQFPGRQGGGITGGGVFSLAPDKTVQLAAACTDLLSEPPDETTRFVSPSLGRVALASGSVATLASAVQEGIVAIRGRSNSFDPVRRDGSLLLDLYLVNTSPEPVQVAIQPGTMITPAGQAAQSLPEGADRLFALAGERRLAYSNTIQYAVWAARGSTAEEVEQSNMVRLSSEEITRVQGLLDGSGIHRQFDRERGVYAGKFAATLDRLGEDTTDVKGETLLPNGARARLEGVRRADGKGAVILRPDRKGGEFYYSAEFKKRADGRVDVKLFHLATGRALHMGKSSLILYPTAG